LKLKSHKQEIKCMKFSRDDDSNLLCSCSSDLVIVWNIKTLVESKLLQGKNVITENLGTEPTQCCFHPNNQIIGICYGEKILLYDINVIF